MSEQNDQSRAEDSQYLPQQATASENEAIRALPWEVDDNGRDLYIRPKGTGWLIAHLRKDSWSAQRIGSAEEHAARIVTACNSHHDLLAALEAITAACEADCCSAQTDDNLDEESVGGGMHGDMALTFGMIRRARAAIAKAESR